MATTGRRSADADALADSLRAADFVRLVPAPTGDGVAAAGILARALRGIDIPFQVGVASVDGATRATEADLVVALDRSVPDADETVGGSDPASEPAFGIARTLAPERADAVLGAAGVVAAGTEPAGPIADGLADAGIEREPGLAVPTTDVADGLAHSTLVHGPFSGDPERARTALEEVTADPGNGEYHRRVASLVALRTAGAAATPRAATAVERALHPHAGGPFATVQGYADVLDAAARTDPGTAVALAMGHETVREAALEAWRRHARRVHGTIRETSIARHAGLIAAEATGPIETVARLLGDYRSPEPLALVAGDDRVALSAPDDADAAIVLAAATDSFDLSGRVVGDDALATQRYPGDVEALVAAIREVRRDG